MRTTTLFTLTLMTTVLSDYYATCTSIPRPRRAGQTDHTDVAVGDTDMKLITVTWYTATLSWSSNHTFTKHYELYCTPLNSTTSKYNRTIILDGSLSNYTFKDLQPEVTYQAWVMNYFSEDVDVLRSNRVEFQTDSVPPDIAQTLLLSQIVDVVLITCLLAFWGIACFAFYRQWSSFHIQLPNRYSHYKNMPKGLENIKVIKRAQDSIIYRNHNQSMSIKISERNRKLARMHTSPAFLADTSESKRGAVDKKPNYKRRTTTLT